MLLLHSWGGDSVTLAAVRRHLAPRETFAPDLPGHGANQLSDFTLDAACDIAEKAISGAGTAHVVGSGTGSLVALALAARFPQRVASLAVAGFPPVRGAAAEQRVEATRAALEQLGLSTFASNYARDTVITRDIQARDVVAKAMERASPRTLVETLRVTLLAPVVLEKAAAPDAALPDEAGPESFPRLVIRGALDNRVPDSNAVGLARELSARIATVPHAGHLAFIDRPDVFAAKLAAHFDKAEGTARASAEPFPAARSNR